MRVGILGSGLMGGKLGTLWARAGHEVVFSYSRREGTLKKLARDAKGNARAGTPREAAEEAEVVLLAVIAHTSSGAEALAKQVRRAAVVAAFGTVPSEVLFSVFEARRKTRRPSLVYCGDDREAKEVVAGLIHDVGFDPVDAGPLRMARYSEPFTLLIARLAYEGEGGPELAYRFERFGKNRLAERRAVMKAGRI